MLSIHQRVKATIKAKIAQTNQHWYDKKSATAGFMLLPIIRLVQHVHREQPLLRQQSHKGHYGPTMKSSLADMEVGLQGHMGATISENKQGSNACVASDDANALHRPLLMVDLTTLEADEFINALQEDGQTCVSEWNPKLLNLEAFMPALQR